MATGEQDEDEANPLPSDPSWLAFGQARREDLLRGRRAAWKALQTLTLSPVAHVVPIGGDGDPVWPPGIVGSISHKRRLAVCAVARDAHYRAIGVDIEQRGPRALRIVERIASAEEQNWIFERDSEDRAFLLFSAKESIYKALHPLCKRYFGFLDAHLGPTADGSLVARLVIALSEDLPAGFSLPICHTFTDEYLVTGVALRR